jgi:hypothetical protein
MAAQRKRSTALAARSPTARRAAIPGLSRGRDSPEGWVGPEGGALCAARVGGTPPANPPPLWP